MSVAHVFAKTNIGDDDQLRTFLFDRADRFLNDSVFRVSPARLLIFCRGNTEEQHRLKSEPSQPFSLRPRTSFGANWKTPGMLAIGRVCSRSFR